MPWLNISNRINKISLTALYIDALMSVMIVGDEGLFSWDYLRTLDYFLYIFVLRSFYCILKLFVRALHCIFFNLQPFGYSF